MFRYCRNCGKPVPEDAKKCGHCGVTPTANYIFCSNCGKTTIDNPMVCPSCKTVFFSKTRESRSKRVTTYLALFLGSLGVHKFYLGFVKEGFIMAAISIIGRSFFWGIPSIIMVLIALIEATIYWKTSEKDFERIYVIERRKWF